MKSDYLKNITFPEYGILIQSRIKRPDYGDKPHAHKYLSIIYIVSGHGTLERDGCSRNLNPDNIVMLNKGSMHTLTDKAGKPMTVFSMYFDPETAGIDRNIVDYVFSSEEPLNLPVYYAELVRRNIRQMLYEQSGRPPGCKMAICQLFNLTLLCVYRAKLIISKNADLHSNADSNTRVMAALEHISISSHEQFSLGDAARLAKVSQRQFTNICRKLTGTSFIKYLNRKRCEKARQLIVSTEMSVASIAFETGYEDISTFYRAFKSIYGTSPMKIKPDLSHQQSNQL
jgi:AraC-like DNA-binding protein